MSSITSLEKDTIREILNIGLARAADSFALIAQGRVLLSVPDFDLVPADELIRLVGQYDEDHYFVAQSDIKGDFNGATLLAFSAEDIRRLSEVCLRQRGPASLVLSEMQRSLLLEVSNIITGALVTQLSNLLRVSVYGAPPTTPGANLAGSLRGLIERANGGAQPVVFTVVTHFQDVAKRLELPLLLFFDRSTFTKIIDTIRSPDFQRLSHSK